MKTVDDLLMAQLQQVWLQEKEAQVYICIYSLWSAWASLIAKRTGIKRVTIYALLKSMEQKWVVMCLQRAGVNIYSVKDPEYLLEQKQRVLDTFAANMSLFVWLQKRWAQAPRIEYVQWIKGIQSMYDAILSSKTPLYAFLSDDDIEPVLQTYLNQTFIKKRREKKLSAHVLVSDTQLNQSYKQHIWTHDPYTVVKFVEKNLTGLSGEIILYNEVSVAYALYSPEELMGYTIHSPQLYASMKSLFTCIWSLLWDT